ncbi:hypothetical protein GCM10027275_05780 [Rhabdobacter roseus]
MLLLWFMAGCSAEEKPPRHILSEDKMAAVLADIHVAEARVTRMRLSSLDSSVMVYNRLQQQIWKKHDVDTLAYRQSYEFYIANPGYMARIYEKVRTKIEAREKTNSIKI